MFFFETCMKLLWASWIEISVFVYFSHFWRMLIMSFLCNWSMWILRHQMILWNRISNLNLIKLVWINILILILFFFWRWWVMIINEVVFKLFMSVSIKSWLIWCSRRILYNWWMLIISCSHINWVVLMSLIHGWHVSSIVLSFEGWTIPTTI